MKRIEKLTALKQYIEDLKNGNCKGEEYYIELERTQIIDAIEYDTEENYTGTLTGEQYYTSTFETNKETLK